MDRIDQLLEAKSTITEKENAKSVKEFNNSIHYKGVTFSYNGEKKVLKNVELEIPKGKPLPWLGNRVREKQLLLIYYLVSMM